MDRQEEFLKLFLKHEGEVRAFTGAIVRDPHGFDDVFQDIALTLWKEFPRYDPGRSFGAWARGVAAKKLMQRWTKTSRLPVPLSPEAIQAISDAYDRSEPAESRKSDALRHCLEKLPERSRRMLVLRYEQGRKLDEIAAEVGASFEAVAQALSRLRSRLHDCVTQWLAAGGGA